MLNTGDVFAGFTVERMLGQGGMGSVYLARHPRLARLTALKLLNPELFADAEVRARFDREADLAAQLDHPNIVAVYDRGVEDEQLWISMQYIDGVDAATVNPFTLPPERAVQIIEGVADALDYAHGNGVLHRDVKPANILLARSGGGKGERVFLSDFGIARLREDSTHLTQAGMFTATLAYASPEQMTGAELDHRSDQYALACALFWLLTGTGPFDSEDPSQLIHGHLQLPVPPVSAFRPGLPAAMDAVIARGMAKRAGDRYRNCALFAAAARAAVSAVPVTGPPPGATAAIDPVVAQPYSAVPGFGPPFPAVLPSASANPAPGPTVRYRVAPVPQGPDPGPEVSRPGVSPYRAAPPNYSPPLGEIGGLASHPGSRRRRLPALLLAATGAATLLLLVILGTTFLRSGHHGDDRGFVSSTPVEAGPDENLVALHSAFPHLTPAPVDTGAGPGFGGRNCVVVPPPILPLTGAGLPALGDWAAAWSCSDGTGLQPAYVLLAYRSPTQVRSVIANLPANRRSVERNGAGYYTNYHWDAEGADHTLYYHVVTAFDDDPTRADYLLFCTDRYLPRIQQGLSAPEFADWWQKLPLT